MRLADAFERPGWVTTDEGGDPLDQYTPHFTIPWSQALAGTISRPDYMLVGMHGPTPMVFRFRRQGDLLSGSYNGLLIRMMLQSSTLGSVAPAPYVGQRLDMLARYGLGPDTWFLPLVPIDLDKMDRLYLESRLVFVGVTPNFGPHIEPQVWRPLGIQRTFRAEGDLITQFQPQIAQLGLGRATEIALLSSERQRDFLLTRLREGDQKLIWMLAHGTVIKSEPVAVPELKNELTRAGADWSAQDR